jgi:hypothetical protein
MRAGEFARKAQRNSKIYLDMDGVLADFFAEYAKMANVKSYRDIPPAKVDPILNSIAGTDFFARLPKFPTTDQLVKLAVSHAGNYHICSSPLRGDFVNSAYWKKIWLRAKLTPQPTTVEITSNKPQHAVSNGVPNILIDDKGSNIRGWIEAGGIGIKYQADEDSLDVVKRALEIIFCDVKDTCDVEDENEVLEHLEQYVEETFDNPYEQGVAEGLLNFEEGDCPIFAIALHRLSKMPLMALVEYDEQMGSTVLIHAYVKLDDRWRIDFTGETDVNWMLQKYPNNGNAEEIEISEKDLLELGYGKSKCPTLQQVLPHAKEVLQNIEEGQQGVAEGENNDTAISLSKLGKFHPGADTLAEFVPERATAQYALHPDKWESTFYSLTNKDSYKLKYYGPKKISIPPGTLVGDMAIANKFYRAKTPEEQEQYAELYKASLQPYPVDVSEYRMPELLIPQQSMAENFADGKNPGRKGLAKRMGVDCSKSKTELRKIAKNSTGEKQRMAHFCANMKK